ncbi:hypothetical protein EJ08DRAFT_661994 [Tothia fuscella]|uniref:Uncharacterized protein n=1 Tax=Tothia fuscella TaxID=1048955 RepID=A0A9P4NPM4_9PEZI|nr:hypothetical protein EJ08DRAFT_661994 [Tothia fuscella]
MAYPNNTESVPNKKRSRSDEDENLINADNSASSSLFKRVIDQDICANDLYADTAIAQTEVAVNDAVLVAMDLEGKLPKPSAEWDALRDCYKLSGIRKFRKIIADRANHNPDGVANYVQRIDLLYKGCAPETQRIFRNEDPARLFAEIVEYVTSHNGTVAWRKPMINNWVKLRLAEDFEGYLEGMLIYGRIGTSADLAIYDDNMLVLAAIKEGFPGH